MSRFVALSGLSLLFALLSGCAQMGSKHEEDTADYQPPMLDYSQPPTTSGGLFRATSAGSLVQDKRALRVGDILTVLLDESTQSSKSADTSYGKTSDLGIGAGKILGKNVPETETTLKSARDFTGTAKSSQQNTLRGGIAVTVHQVMPNGTLLIKGEKALRLNQGDEFIRLSGLVRLEDINNNNQVSSLNVANARISYSGRGTLNDSNSAGWLTRFFTHPLFPF